MRLPIRKSDSHRRSLEQLGEAVTLHPRPRGIGAAKILGLIAAAGATAVVVRFFPDLRRYLRIKRM